MKIRILGNSPHLKVEGFKQGDIIEVIEDDINCINRIEELVEEDGNARLDLLGDVCLPCVYEEEEESVMWLFHTSDDFGDENTFYEEYKDESN